MDSDDFLEIAGWLALTVVFLACVILGWSTVVEGAGHFVASLI